MIDVKVEDSGLNIDVTIEGSGPPGKAGENGVSPTVDVTETENGHKVVITDKDGEKSFDVSNGQNGEDGEDGVSPTVAVEDVEGGHKVIITGAAGPKEFVVLNGKNGQTQSITIGTVETLPADSPAKAEIVGQTPNLTMNLGTPQGPKGATGLGVPVPTPEDAGKFPMVNPEGNGYDLSADVLRKGKLVSTVTTTEPAAAIEILDSIDGFTDVEIFIYIGANPDNVDQPFLAIVNGNNQNFINPNILKTTKNAYGYATVYLKKKDLIFSDIPMAVSANLHSYGSRQQIARGLDISRWKGPVILTSTSETWQYGAGTKVQVWAV